MDAHANFAYSTVATAPSPATTGTSLVVAAGNGALFPAVPFNAVIWPTGTQPLSSNAEIVRVTAISTDTLTITREQESTTARTVVVGDQIMAAITAKTLTDLEPSVITASPSADQNDYAPTGWAGCTTLRLTHTAPFVISGFAAGVAGERKRIVNCTAEYPIVICDEAVTSSSAANRVKVSATGYLRGHYLLLPGDAIVIEYDGTSSRWRVVGESAGAMRRALRLTLSWIPNPSGNYYFVGPGSTVYGNTPSGVNTSSGSYRSERASVNNNTTGSAASTSGARTFQSPLIRGSAAGRGGFLIRLEFSGINVPGTACALFLGVRNTATAIGDVDTSTLVNVYGVGLDPTQSTLRAVKNDGTGTATMTDLGANYPFDQTACHELHLLCAPGSAGGMSGVIWRQDDLSIVPKVWYDSTEIPAAGTALNYMEHIGNRAAAAAYGFQHFAAEAYTP